MSRNKTTRREKTVPEKDLSVWHQILDWFKAALPSLSAMGVSAAVAVLRVLYDDHVNGKSTSWKPLALEGPLCGLITLAMASGLELFDVPQSASQFVGGMIGLFGVLKVRDIASRWLAMKGEDRCQYETTRK